MTDDRRPPSDDTAPADDEGRGRLSWRSKPIDAHDPPTTGTSGDHPGAPAADDTPRHAPPLSPIRPLRLPPGRMRPAPLGPGPAPRRPATPLLDRIGRDLTHLARAGRLRDIVGRDDLVLAVARGLLRRDKPNPLLVGEAGVGKTAIVEGLAQRLVAADIDQRLAGLRLVEIPVSAIVAGTTLRGSLEARVRELLDELRGRRDIVIFLDEIHQVLGAGAAERTDLDVAEMLKPALARGEIRCIGATTPADIEPILRQDQALARRLLPLRVEEMPEDAARSLVAALAPGYAAHHRVDIAPEAAAAAVALGVRYLRDRRLPDKALDLLDDACARVALPALALPAVRPGARPLVTASDVAAVIEARLGVTVPAWDPALSGAEHAGRAVPLDLADKLGRRVIGQPAAVAAVADSVRVASLGLRAADRPRAVLLFGGPTGVGKTALARSLAVELFGDERALLRLDMSEFREAHETSRLTGTTAGYVGYGDGGQLARFLRHTPEAVVLLDEIEKAHPDVLDLFLQLFDAGRITDGQGREVDARHAYVVMTTNIPLDDDLARLRARLRPEFLNRVDRVVAFRPLELPELETIARHRLDAIVAGLEARRVYLDIDPAAVTALARPEDDGRAANGRTVERRLERDVLAPVAELVALLPRPAADAPLTLRLVAGSDGCRVVPAGGTSGFSA